jgi:putative transposase
VAYWRLFYHVVWATKNREPAITTEVEDRLKGYLVGKAREMRTIVHGIGCAEDHIHVVASVPPSIALASVVARLKGSSSHYLNTVMEVPFSWQGGYGAMSLGEKQLKVVVEYAENQSQHHAQGTVVPAMEETAADADGPAPAGGSRGSPRSGVEL